LLLIVLFFYLALMISNVGEENQIFERIFASADELDTSDKNTRAYLYDLAIKLSLQYPIVGFGLELPNGEGYPHNIFLESFLALGICGGLMFILITSYTIIASLKLLATKNSQWGWLGILFIQYTIGGCSSGSLYAASSFWYLLFAVLGVCNSVDNKWLSRELSDSGIE
jgi:O-antigen ligase